MCQAAGSGVTGEKLEMEGGARSGVGGKSTLDFFVSRIEATESFKQVCSFKMTLAAGWRVACRVSHKEGTIGLYDGR